MEPYSLAGDSMSYDIGSLRGILGVCGPES